MIISLPTTSVAPVCCTCTTWRVNQSTAWSTFQIELLMAKKGQHVRLFLNRFSLSMSKLTRSGMSRDATHWNGHWIQLFSPTKSLSKPHAEKKDMRELSEVCGHWTSLAPVRRHLWILHHSQTEEESKICESPFWFQRLSTSHTWTVSSGLAARLLQSHVSVAADDKVDDHLRKTKTNNLRRETRVFPR